MARTNLLKIDDLLFRAARLLALLWLASTAIAFALVASAEPGSGPGLLPVAAASLVFATAPIGLLAAGLRVRRREHRAWALVRLIDDHVEIPVRELLRDSDFTPQTLERAIRDLNNAVEAFLVWDRKAGVVQDGRLRRSQLQVDECSSCGAKVQLSLPIGSAEGARCPFCHGALLAERIVEEKSRLIDELDDEVARTRRAATPERSFSIPLFVILSLAFWPLGVGYALWHWQASRPAS
jgi:hypothetical protein